jgi:hypothetical protein
MVQGLSGTTLSAPVLMIFAILATSTIALAFHTILAEE